jgi:hypothetical protein
VRLEELTEDQLTALQQQFTELHDRTNIRLERPLANPDAGLADANDDTRAA